MNRVPSHQIFTLDGGPDKPLGRRTKHAQKTPESRQATASKASHADANEAVRAALVNDAPFLQELPSEIVVARRVVLAPVEPVMKLMVNLRARAKSAIKSARTREGRVE